MEIAHVGASGQVSRTRSEVEVAGMKEINDRKERFKLTYKSDIIGWLEYDNGKWEYSYSDEFKTGQKLQPLADFPKLDRVYQSDTLWPFFALRIPGSGQPRVQNFIKRNNGSAFDVDLLKEFGTTNIANPFRLVSES